MTEQNEIQNQEQSLQKKSEKKKQFFLLRIVITISIIAFCYFGFQYWQVEKSKNSQSKIIESGNGSEHEIFDLADEYKNQGNQQDDLSDISVNEMKERGAEFIYQLLLKNQTQIDDLRTQIQALKGEILKYKNQEKIGKMILSYADLRAKIFVGKNFFQELKSFEIIVASDDVLEKKVERLQPLLKNFSTREKLQQSFAKKIPELITAKHENPSSNGIIDKIRNNIARLIIIRRIDGKNPQDIDGIIVKIEKFLAEESYQDALNSALLLPQNYHEILQDFLNDLSTSLEVQKIDQEILNYLKSLA
jgi:hypothetical protein